MIKKLIELKQEHLLRFEDELTAEQKQQLHNQINGLNFNYLQELTKKKQEEKANITPIKAMTVEEIASHKAEFEEIGLQTLKNQEVGMLLLAGGMGTRLGSDNPKGMFNIGKTKDVYIFQRLIENALDVVEKVGVEIPFFIMTSDKNHNETVSFVGKSGSGKTTIFSLLAKLYDVNEGEILNSFKIHYLNFNCSSKSS